MLVGCLFVSQAIAVPLEPVEETDGVDEDNIDLGEMLQDLFDVREPRDVEEVVEEVEDEAEEEQEEEVVEDTPQKEEISPQEVARFNNYMDAIYRRMNAALRAKLMDPMTLNLNQKIKSKEKEKVNRVERDVDVEEEEEEEDTLIEEVESVDRIGLAKRKKNKKNGKGRSRPNKGNKNKNSKNKNKNKKSGNGKNKNKRERGQNRKNIKLEGARNKQSGNNKKRKNQNKNTKGKNRQKGNGKNARDGKGQQKPAMGSLSGMATLRRDGDVKITNADNHKTVKSSFTVGPLELEVSRKYGNGKGRTVRTAKAVTDVMEGVMQLKVKEDGSAHIINVLFKRPEDVAVSGSLSNDRRRSDTFVKNSVNRMRPLAAQRILKTARYVLKAPQSKDVA